MSLLASTGVYQTLFKLFTHSEYSDTPTNESMEEDHNQLHRDLLTDLPIDAQLRILSFLNLQEVLHLGTTCRSIHHLVSDSESLWMSFCEPWKHLLDLQIWRSRLDSAQSLFRLLLSFNRLVGPWTLNAPDPHGTLVYITWGDLALVAYKVFPFGREDLKVLPIFEIVGQQNGSFRIEYFGPDIQDESSLSSSTVRLLVQLKRVSKNSLELILPCQSLKKSSNGKVQQALQCLTACRSMVQEDQNRETSFSRLHVAEGEFLGLWHGSYGPHGIEILNVTQTDDEIFGTKVLGDPNVPCGQVSFKANLSLGELEAPEDLQDIIDIQLTDHQQFSIVKIYNGYGQIAQDNYTNPEWTPGLLLVSSTGQIAFLWEDDDFTIIYERLDLRGLCESQK